MEPKSLREIFKHVGTPVRIIPLMTTKRVMRTELRKMQKERVKQLKAKKAQ